MLAARPDIRQHHEAEAALTVAGERQAVHRVRRCAERRDRLGVGGDLGERRGRAGNAGLLEQVLVVPQDRQVGEVGDAVILVPDRRQGQVAGAEHRLVRQSVHVGRDVHESALVRELGDVDVVEAVEVRRVAGSDRRRQLARVVVGRRYVVNDLQIWVRGVELGYQLQRCGLCGVPYPERHRSRGVDAEGRVGLQPCGGPGRRGRDPGHGHHHRHRYHRDDKLCMRSIHGYNTPPLCAL